MRVWRVRWAWVMALLAVVAACQGEPAIEETPEPSPSPSPTPTPLPVAEPEPEPEPTVDPEAEREALLAELRESDAFVEFAEHDRALSGRWSRFTFTEFGMSADGEIVAEWTNKRELWDEVAPPFRDECLLAGPPATEPIWDDEIMIPVTVTARWSEHSTDGRGQFLDLMCAYIDTGSGETVERYSGILVVTDTDGRGRIAASMAPVEVRETAVLTKAERSDLIRPLFWEWVLEQEVRS